MSSAATTQNGRIDSPARLDARFGFAHVLGRMNGTGFFAYNLWHHPETKFFEDVDVDAHSDEYLQCAGSAQALTVEMRVRSGTGYDHWVLATAPTTGSKDHTITWDDDFSTQVHAEEVFTSDQAAPLFEQYYTSGTIPETVPRRRL